MSTRRVWICLQKWENTDKKCVASFIVDVRHWKLLIYGKILTPFNNKIKLKIYDNQL